MQTNLIEKYKQTTFGQRADQILRNCVHCGFCTATCPTYQLLGDELDGPRGRIYLIKQILEGQTVSHKTLTHLDRCLTCRSCETTCPSGVEYGKLIDIGRQLAESEVRRPLLNKLKRELLHWLLSRPVLFGRLYHIAGKLERYLPQALRVSHQPQTLPEFTARPQARKVILLQGCVQPTMAPNINLATQRVLNHIGIETIQVEQASCCGAISHHLNKHEVALRSMRHNIDAWWPYINRQGCEAIISNASGCGVMLKDYADQLADDPAYADKAKIISDMVKDVSELIHADDIPRLALKTSRKVAFHAPCTLQHGLKLKAKTESLLQNLGMELTQIKDAHLCCGSAGTYSILEPVIAAQLKQAKLKNLLASQPELIVTANIGCQHHLQSASTLPVRHWVELLADNLS